MQNTFSGKIQLYFSGVNNGHAIKCDFIFLSFSLICVCFFTAAAAFLISKIAAGLVSVAIAFIATSKEYGQKAGQTQEASQNA